MAKQNEKRGKARSLFLTGEYTQKEIAAMCGVSQKTIGEWKEEENWEDMQTSLLTSRENELKRLYKILKALNDQTLQQIDAGEDVNTKLADSVIKYTAAIKSLEMETSIADKVDVGMKFIDFIRKDDVEFAKKVTKFFDLFIQDSIN
jgi:DNA-binding XRE family transcriptional regulator